MRAFALLLVAVALTACGADPKEEARTLARAKGPPLYYLGDEFEELPLTHVEPHGFFVYGECDGEGSGDTFHCTKPQVQLQHHARAQASGDVRGDADRVAGVRKWNRRRPPGCRICDIGRA